VNRRTFVRLAAALLPFDGDAELSSIPIIDTHIHLFDPTRPQGVPWPPKDDPVLYKPALPARFRSVAELLGVVGAIEIEASPWLDDNQWVLDIAAKNPIIGTIGDLEPGKPEFLKQLDRFHKNPLFRGIRYGNLWGRDLGARLSEPAFVADLKALANADLVLDTANPDPALIRAVVRLTDQVSDLRVVIDHLPSLKLPEDRASRGRYEHDLRLLGARPQGANKQATLDQLWHIFGEDRLLYGSDWPNSDPWGTYAQVLHIVRQYFAKRSRSAAEKFFWKNSVQAYRWVKRDPKQPDV
jgi:L-fuconolactonase